jgi:hypothetical protein
VTGGKCASEEKSRPSDRGTIIDLVMKMIRNYEDGKSLSEIVHELGFVVSISNTIMKDDALIKEHDIFIFHLLYIYIH